MHVLEILQARGFVQQTTGLDALRAALDAGTVTFYVGVDPTASSMHVGHMLPVMAMMHLQQAGHRPISVVGGGTAMVGDPSGKSEMRQLISREEIEQNTIGLREQLRRFLVLDGDRGLLVDNADWLLNLAYIDFLRDIGRHFSVNRMLAAEAYKQRLERGLSFIEFNYQLLQAYDFLELYRRHGCTLQMGGDDQWGNILAGTDLVRRVAQADVHGLTFPLLTTASGAKMGKTAQGAVWLDAERTPPFDFFQYWLNVDDRDVGKLLRLYTFVDLDEIARLEALEGADIREAKRTLARDVTTRVHGAEACAAAEAAAAGMVTGDGSDDMPRFEVASGHLAEGIKVYAVLADAGLCRSRGEARRLIKQGGVRLNGVKVDDPEGVLSDADMGDGGAVVRVGKKRAVQVVAA